MIVPPGSTIGIVGGGQLGRMLSLAAAQLGYSTYILDPHEHPCAADVAAGHLRAAFDDMGAIDRFAALIDVATYEFENLAVEPLSMLGAKLRPGVKSLAIAQDRAEEKQFIEASGARVAPWRQVATIDDVHRAMAELGLPVLLKTRRYGYDGKGQVWIRSAGDAEQAWRTIGEEPSIAEAGVAFDAEFSVILARSADGSHAFWDSAHNVHEDGILRRSTVPGTELIRAQVDDARRFSLSIAEALGHVGVLTVEFFAAAEGPVVNEIAPRVHNSGHWTIEGAETSQFEQHVRAVCGLPLGSTALTARGAVMENLIGAEALDWEPLIGRQSLHVHLYGKGEARPGRKMGHVTQLRR